VLGEKSEVGLLERVVLGLLGLVGGGLGYLAEFFLVGLNDRHLGPV
jgi:hypothetical protein